ncbi:AraC family transcriptional regulator [Microlunatus soli]|uniref:AraC-type DNA-binding protein n=1 Tax=Microlunatus soli TaxID=630515 RepID=A0A1H1NKY3_9ACTN|nr:AraC family transcriptional regulator [Microlunatus soli]SDR99701.1 AraC-type DNA-binding protein [Microlunatus soli]
MINTIFDSRRLPADQRLPRFDHLQRRSPHAMGVSSAEPEQFTALARSVELPQADLVDLSISTAQIRRSPRLVRTSDPGVHAALLLLRGRIGIRQLDREAILHPGDLTFYTSSAPFQIQLGGIGTDAGPVRLVRVQVPQERVQLGRPATSERFAEAVPTAHGMPALFADFLKRLADDREEFGAADLVRLDTVAADLFAATLQSDPTPADDDQQALLTMINDHVRRHLSDPALSPRSIAAAHNISLSVLHRLFRVRGITVAAWIRRLRLETARRLLTDPASAGVPVRRIGARVGYVDHSTFTRAFTAAYGMSPSAHRRISSEPDRAPVPAPERRAC